MNRPALRFLAVGFLVSALILSGYRLFLYEPKANAESSSSKNTAALSKEEKSYKEKYEELLTKVEVEKVTGDSSNEAKTDTSTSDAEKKKAEEAAAKKKAEEEATAKKKAEEESKVKKYTLVISPGDPTSTAVDQLASEGIIKDANEFTQFLSGNDYEMYIRDGSYEVDSSMTYEQIAKIITHR